MLDEALEACKHDNEKIEKIITDLSSKYSLNYFKSLDFYKFFFNLFVEDRLTEQFKFCLVKVMTQSKINLVKTISPEDEASSLADLRLEKREFNEMSPERALYSIQDLLDNAVSYDSDIVETYDEEKFAAYLTLPFVRRDPLCRTIHADFIKNILSSSPFLIGKVKYLSIRLFKKKGYGKFTFVPDIADIISEFDPELSQKFYNKYLFDPEIDRDTNHV